MRYDDNLIEEVRERNDIVDVISSYVTLTKKGRDYFGLCPFHSEKTASFSVSRNKQMYYCFGCHAGGNVFTFLMEYNRLSFSEAMEELARRGGVELPVRERSPEEQREADSREVLKEMNRQAAVYYHVLLKNNRGRKAMEYLKNRGLTDETIRQFGLGYADIYRDDLYRYLKGKGFKDRDMKDSSLVTIDTEKGSHDRFFNRVMFPIMDVRNRVIGFGGRVMGSGEPKYLNSKETILFDKGRNLYGLNYAKRTKDKTIILCEGYMDVISLHQAGFTNAVAPLGTSFTQGQAMLLKRYTSEAVLSFDSDGAGEKAALRALPILREAGIRGRVLSLKPFKDPDELIQNRGAGEYEKRIREAEDGRIFEMRVLEKQYDQSDPGSRTEFIHLLAEMITEIPDVAERNVYLDSASRRFMVRRDVLEELVNSYGKNLEKKRANDQYKKAPQTAEKRKAGIEERRNRPQKLLLTWLVERPETYPLIVEHVGPEDFTHPLYRSVAWMLFDQLEEGGDLNPARITARFHDLEEQAQVADLFYTHLQYEPLPENQDKALTEIVKKVRESSLDEQLAHTTDIVKAQELMMAKSRLSRLEIRRDRI